jgi:glycosyltransferase involved in cell wall biosynthesis
MAKITGSETPPNKKLPTAGELRKFFSLTQNLSGFYYLISRAPIIFHVARSRNPVSAFEDQYKFLFDHLKDEKVYFLCTWWWHTEKMRHTEQIKQSEDKLLSRYPSFNFIHLSNTARQNESFRESGLNSIFCNQNCFVDERIFKPLPGIEKKYNAVYDARIIEFKRHYLASEIDALALIYGQNHFSEDDKNYIEETKIRLCRARYFNHSESGEYKNLSAPEINECFNKCRVGLCLSAVEGAMYASIQYLLGGLPVVTTKSLGGRDVFFDEEIAITVEADPESVKRGVEEMISRNLKPAYVRQKTLDKMQRHRNRFISLVQEIYRDENTERDFAAEWDSVFCNKLLKNTNHLDIIRYLNLKP